MEHILKNVTSSSLILIDELFRSTDPTEGVQLAWTFCEHLLSLHGRKSSEDLFTDEVDENVNIRYFRFI